MFNENSLFWVVAHPLFFLLVVACDAIPNDEFEVELAVYVGRQLGREIVWVESFAVEGCTLDDIGDLEELAYEVAESPVILQKAKQVIRV